MVLLSEVLFGVLFLIGITSSTALPGYKNCPDCVKITKCLMANQRVKNDKSEATARLLRYSHCGNEGGYPKVCCNNFMIGARMLEDELDDFIIENHPNIQLLSQECGDTDGSKIVGGSRTTLYEFPWLAIVFHDKAGTLRMNCVGSLIHSRYVLTAAHCISGRKVAKVRIGDYDLATQMDCTGEDSDTECAPKYQEIDVEEQIPHAAYSDDPLIINDIGLLRLKEHVDLTLRNSGLICLPVTSSLLTMNIYGERGTVAGWGVTENHAKSDVLLKVAIPIYSPGKCLKKYNRNGRLNMDAFNRLKNTLCAGEAGHDSCSGDSGGPLMVDGFISDTFKLIQMGIVSYGGDRECGYGRPTIYTDVRKYMKWILDNIKPESM